MFKKVLRFAGVLGLGLALTACASDTSTTGSKSGADSGASKSIDKLSIGFVPSRDPEEIVSATKPLKDLLKKEMKKQGYSIKDVDISVGTSYEAVGESLSSGTLDVGFIPGGTYVLYDDGAEVLLAATRAGLSNDSEDPVKWNENKPTKKTDKQAASYRSLLIAGPSAKGQALGKKINSGEKLTWDDLNSASWSVMSSSSSAGYIYPSLWLKDHYKKNISDLKHIVQADSYGSSMARLAAGQADIMVAFADARMDYEKQWQKEYGRKASIWDETNVLGVTPPIYNDTISVSKNSKIMNAGLKKALSQAFINIGKSEEGKKVIAIYAHEGYKKATSADYDNAREAQKLVKAAAK
ncbi:phosphate/phosphite/phosphonate ABC transporter substrate-binding protein [Lapidilactobacillus achengensis]|uniref:Phosphate/phosphite/phosphonate ABC transporter substrate-binding protein n=1 Tax=Lapidilactobacillus achengensis TaxID=2486000 RepID=A0ABW1URD8_9LACO